jgi:hypothetical protein
VAVRVSRRIGAPAAVIFRVLADPGRHTELDGSGMLRGAVNTAPVTGVEDVFIRRIGWEPAAGRGHPDAAAGQDESRWGHRWSYELVPDGADATIVTEIYDCSRAPADARAEMSNGEVWADGMARTLERLDAACKAGQIRTVLSGLTGLSGRALLEGALATPRRYRYPPGLLRLEK